MSEIGGRGGGVGLIWTMSKNMHFFFIEPLPKDLFLARLNPIIVNYKWGKVTVISQVKDIRCLYSNIILHDKSSSSRVAKHNIQ